MKSSELGDLLLHPANRLDQREELLSQNKELPSDLESSLSYDILCLAGDTVGPGPVM